MCYLAVYHSLISIWISYRYSKPFLNEFKKSKSISIMTILTLLLGT